MTDQLLDPQAHSQDRVTLSGRGKPRLGELLLRHGLISKDQLAVALHERQRSTKMLGEILVDFGFITEDALSSVLAEATGFNRFDPSEMVVDPELIRAVPKEVAETYRVLPLSFDGNSVRVAMADPYDVMAMDQIRRYLPKGLGIDPKVCTPVALQDAIDRAYGYEMSIEGILAELGSPQGLDQVRTGKGEEDEYTHPIVRLVNAILLDAVKVGASDLHFEPEAMFMRLRYRVDGVMTQVHAFHKDHWPAICHRLKILAGCNIANRFQPQDGRFTMELGSREIDFRVSTMPTVHGENVALRVLDKAQSLRALGDLGFGKTILRNIDATLRAPEGLVIVTGPTGSGKTTTLYAMLEKISSPSINIMTLEDPVEYQLPMIRQTQVNEQTGLGFSEGLRALMRQGPDTLLLGEVRDHETASQALRAAMTGHKVFTTLHTNDAIGAVPRLFDLGLNPNLVAGTLLAVVSQRLVRRLCTFCKTDREASDAEKVFLGARSTSEPLQVSDPHGCPKCRHTGYHGRIAIGEVLVINDAMNEAISAAVTRAELKRLAISQGFRPMVLDGIDKVTQGLIDIQDLLRVTPMAVAPIEG